MLLRHTSKISNRQFTVDNTLVMPPVLLIAEVSSWICFVGDSFTDFTMVNHHHEKTPFGRKMFGFFLSTKPANLNGS